MLDAGGILTLLGDQSAGKKGCWVTFFGRPASTHKAVSLFSLGNEAPTMVSYARRIGRPLHYEVGPEAIGDPREPDFAAAERAALGPMVHRPSGESHSPGAGPVLVAPPPLEGPADGAGAEGARSEQSAAA